jgi:hypothetical protein
VLGVDGDVGYNVAPNGTATRVSNPATRDRRADLHHHPSPTFARARSRREARDPDQRGQPEHRARHDA